MIKEQVNAIDDDSTNEELLDDEEEIIENKKASKSRKAKEENTVSVFDPKVIAEIIKRNKTEEQEIINSIKKSLRATLHNDAYDAIVNDPVLLEQAIGFIKDMIDRKNPDTVKKILRSLRVELKGDILQAIDIVVDGYQLSLDNF
jgi:hypothetical protein